MLHYLGLMLILVSWCAAYLFFKRWHNPELRSISKHAASARAPHIFFIAALGFLGALFYVWLITWFSPKLHLGVIFDVLTTITIACQIITAIVPDTQGILKAVHRITAYTMAILYLPLSVIILHSHYVSNIARTIGVIIFIFMLATFTIAAVLYRSEKRYLIYQGLYVIAFQVLILTTAYIWE